MYIETEKKPDPKSMASDRRNTCVLTSISIVTGIFLNLASASTHLLSSGDPPPSAASSAAFFAAWKVSRSSFSIDSIRSEGTEKKREMGPTNREKDFFYSKIAPSVNTNGTIGFCTVRSLYESEWIWGMEADRTVQNVTRFLSGK